jgi:excisionase family DNA binding protein
LSDAKERILTGQAASRLGTSKQTIRDLINKGELRGVREKRGGSFAWLVETASVEEFLREHGAFQGKRRRTSRLGRLEAEVAALKRTESPLHREVVASADLERERDDLRAQVVTLEEVLARTQSAAELQRAADDERAIVMNKLIEALAAAERADALRRAAVDGLRDALAAAPQPGHPGQLP